ncbi:protein YgfX [Collimonas pratensis]|uniref:Flagellar hook-length control protein n=1 Tax=Collimonas pratensis TaxID=279113 RepID=A0A127QVQ6_9BURK|nr:protein YgfX [Collimonas pratensis]AMP04046.1 putative flagellar hook-length control protein [Collimonas pratensis]AMP13986.1 putative flagellar hook-length control protein [Collimonas pratensis]NKI68586.1 flagellar hook-length control protein [Collimonas pratensis]
MSIALSTVVKPSRLLLALVAMQCTLAGLVGALVAGGVVGTLLLPARVVLATLCLAAAIYGMLRYYRERSTIQVEIGADGQIRLADIAAQNGKQILRPMLAPAQLLESTTIWSNLLLLRLRLASGSVRTIAILPDCVSKDTFRVLSVACRWIAAHRSSTHKTGIAGLANE